jgi:nucleotide-binding universal stress UspA family protein
MRRAKLVVVTVDLPEPSVGPDSAGTDMSALLMALTAPAVVAAEDIGPPLQVSVPLEFERAVSAELAEWPALPVAVEAWEGRPSAVLAERSAGAAMVLVGARGRGGFSGLRLGSVAEKVLHLASCPAVLVPSSRRPERSDGSGGVVVGFDIGDGLSERQRAKIDFAVEEARLRAAPLEVAAVQLRLGKLRHPSDWPASRANQAEEAIAKVLQDEIDTKGVELTVKILRGSVAGELATVGQDADLLVIGSGTGGLAPGTVRDQVVHYARCPVALYKQRASAGSAGTRHDPG